jgi:HTH-type transcriptional regulator/antitoxin HigA
MSHGSALSAAENDRLEVLTVLIEAFESGQYPVEPPDPIDAILFRMEEKGLKQADLIPYFGTSSRVSEVLKRKRPMTVQMIRAVSLGLGISAETLLGLAELVPANMAQSVDWAKFPIKEMVQRGWIETITGRSATSVEKLVKTYISEAGLQIGGAVAFRRTLSGDAESPTTRYSLYAWLARVIQQAREKKSQLGPFDRNVLSAAFLRQLAQLSWSNQGPLLAVEFLEKHGVAVVVEPHLKGTRLDGAALKDVDGTPIVGLTLRFDRLDNFWFTLLHEVAHLWRHVTDDSEAFVDDLNVGSEDRREAEANRLAREAIVPRVVWKRSNAYNSPTRVSIEQLAKELKIHPALIVGRLHKETGNYVSFSDLVGHNQVRQILFSSNG